MKSASHCSHIIATTLFWAETSTDWRYLNTKPADSISSILGLLWRSGGHTENEKKKTPEEVSTGEALQLFNVSIKASPIYHHF